MDKQRIKGQEIMYTELKMTEYLLPNFNPITYGGSVGGLKFKVSIFKTATDQSSAANLMKASQYQKLQNTRNLQPISLVGPRTLTKAPRTVFIIIVYPLYV